MKKPSTFLLMLAVGGCASALHAAPDAANLGRLSQRASPAATRTSASYSLVAEEFDAGGTTLLSSASYAVKGASVGGTGAVATSRGYTVKGGYAGQLYDLVGITTSASANTVNENAARQLSAGLLLDDQTQLALATDRVDWSVVSGPVSFPFPTSGLVMAGTVYQNSSATVRARYAGYNTNLVLTVLNVNLDDYGSYAGDGIDDAWQVAYFGLDNPQAAPGADADGTGQTNLFKYLAGLNPLDTNSRFVLAISALTGQLGQRSLTFSPRYDGRTYTVQSTTSLIQPNWMPLTSLGVSDSGTTRTITDLDTGTGAARFYRVQISAP